MTMSNYDELFMREALLLAKKAYDIDEVPIGSLITIDNNIISTGYNQVITSCNPCHHAEIECLIAASKSINNYRLTGATLYVTIEPCAMCFSAMVHSRIDRLVFGSLQPKMGAVFSNLNLINSNHWNHKIEVEYGVLADECKSIMQKFFKSKR